jgi:hypothetical protein
MASRREELRKSLKRGVGETKAKDIADRTDPAKAVELTSRMKAAGKS